jgi:hypothetical protein
MRFVICIPALWLAAACGSSTDDDTPRAIPLEEVPAVYAEALCESLTRCAGPLLEVFLAGEDCVTTTTERISEEIPRLEQAIEDGRVQYRGDRLQACADEIRSRGCATLNDREPDVCQQALDGTVAIGGDCVMDEECDGAARCDFAAACPGQCTELAAEGEACDENDHCASGLSCSETSGRCETPGGPGDACEAGEPSCGFGYACAGADAENDQPGHCRTYDEVFAGADGDVCDPVNAVLCAPSLSCQVDAFTVATGIEAHCAPSVGSAASCRVAFPDQCPDDEYCDVPASALEGTCKPRPAIGQPCGLEPFETEGTICEAYARCNGGVCKALSNLGESCAVDAVCYSGHCEAGSCGSTASCE